MSAHDSKSGGSRFDSISGRFGTLYCGSDPLGCYVETLARYRPDPELRELVRGEWERNGWMRTGNVPRSWRDERRLAQLVIEPDAAFLDVEAPETRSYLERELRPALTAFGVDHLDVPVIRGKDRRVTRMIAEWAFTYRDDAGNIPYSGIRYLSKVDTDCECWAVFQGVDVAIRQRTRIKEHDATLQQVSRLFDIKVH